MRSKGFSVGYPLFMSMFIFAGSMEFVTVQSAVVSLSSPVSLSAGIDGQCQALVLWNLHAG